MALLESDTPKALIDDIGAALAGIYAAVEVRIQTELARRLYAGLEIYPELLTRLQNIRDLEELTAAELARVDVDAVARLVIESAAASGVAAAAYMLRDWVVPSSVFTPTAVDAVTAIQLDLKNSLLTMHERIIRAVPDIYQELTAAFVPRTIIGGESLWMIHKALVNEYLEQGITGFVDAGGRNWRIGSYAEMSVRTTTMRAWTDASIARMQAGGINTVTPVGTRAACSKCLPWQGKILSTDGRPAGIYMMNTLTGGQAPVKVDATLAQAREAGLQHPNCHDTLVSVFAGQPLTFQPPPGFSLDGESAANRAEAKLRRLEVDTRDAKRMTDVMQSVGELEQADGYRAEVRRLQGLIREHVAETGIVRKRYREQLTFADGGTANPRG